VSDFRSKLHPWFIDFAELFQKDYKHLLEKQRQKKSSRDYTPTSKSRLSSLVPAPLLPGWPQTLGDMLVLIDKQGGPESGMARMIQENMSREERGSNLNDAMENVLAMIKYQTTAVELRWREVQGDRAAGKKLVEVIHLRNLWLHDQLPSGGLRFKTNVYHNLLVTYGLAAGLSELNTSEMIDFFDQYCPCGDVHSLEVMRRLRQKLWTMLERGREAATLIAELAATRRDPPRGPSKSMRLTPRKSRQM
jgi:hypothetical protein